MPRLKKIARKILTPISIYFILLLIIIALYVWPTAPQASGTIINPHNFNFVYNPGDKVCSSDRGKSVSLLIYVHSNPKNFKNRLAIRETWGNSNIFPKVRTVFMLGASRNYTINHLLKLESEIYNDIVSEDFIDAYRNITFKAVMAMKLVSTHCQNVRFILKTDDDTVVDMYSLSTYLKYLEVNDIASRRSIMCYVNKRSIVDRNSRSKWYISKSEIFVPYYKPYCAGAAYLFSPDLPQLFYNLSFYVKFFWIDDYYITGMLTYITKTHLIDLHKIISMDGVDDSDDEKSKYTKFYCIYIYI
jgi:beta-1,3-galactosyltransferase 1